MSNKVLQALKSFVAYALYFLLVFGFGVMVCLLTLLNRVSVTPQAEYHSIGVNSIYDVDCEVAFCGGGAAPTPTATPTPSGLWGQPSQAGAALSLRGGAGVDCEVAFCGGGAAPTPTATPTP